MNDDPRNHAMSDDALRAALQAAHDGDAPPPFARTLDNARSHDASRSARRRVIPVLALAVAAILVLVLRRHPDRPALAQRRDAEPRVALDGLGMRSTTLRLPTDSLLDIPGQDLLATTPDLTGGTLP